MNRSIYSHAECFMRRLKAQHKCIWCLSKQSCDALNRLERHCLDAYRVFYGKIATIGHYNLVSIPHFCRNSLIWTILVKICSLRCTANCSVLYGELPKNNIRTVRQLVGST
jgi:hypothetical protein